MRILKPIGTILFLGLIIFALYNWLIVPNMFREVRVVHMIDADSLLVKENGKLLRVQLIGIDAPEKTGVEKWHQCHDAEALTMAAKLFEKVRSIRLQKDSLAGDVDIHGRALRYVYLHDGTMLNEELIRLGMAKEYHPLAKSYEFLAKFESLQAKAAEKKIGLWASDTCGGKF